MRNRALPDRLVRLYNLPRWLGPKGARAARASETVLVGGVVLVQRELCSLSATLPRVVAESGVQLLVRDGCQ